ncbi:hypothetical protein BDV06DRAFT_217131 [Aspergillus oleicola]
MAQILQKIFLIDGYYEIMDAILSHLTASATAALLAALQVKLSLGLKHKFLNPLRDIDHTMQLIRSWTQDEHRILMIGPDCGRLLSRIKNPMKFYAENASDRKLEVWVVAIPNSVPKYVEKVGRLRRIWHKKRRGHNTRTSAMTRLEHVINKSIISQYAETLFSQMDDGRQTVCGDDIQIKWFDLKKDYSGFFDNHSIRLEFRGLKCCLPWNLCEFDPGNSYWSPGDGIPYIDAADPFHLQKAEKRVSRGMISHDSNMLFCSMAPEWRPQSPVILPINL